MGLERWSGGLHPAFLAASDDGNVSTCVPEDWDVQEALFLASQWTSSTTFARPPKAPQSEPLGELWKQAPRSVKAVQKGLHGVVADRRTAVTCSHRAVPEQVIVGQVAAGWAAVNKAQRSPYLRCFSSHLHPNLGAVGIDDAMLAPGTRANGERRWNGGPCAAPCCRERYEMVVFLRCVHSGVHYERCSLSVLKHCVQKL